jgi:sugar lactone lactonase YvrE
MTSKPEVIADVLFGEGPSWCPDGTVVCTSVAEGRLYRVWPEERRAAVLAVTGGGANACAPAADGGFLVTQNGGIDFSRFSLPGFESLPPFSAVAPGLQYAAPDGTVTYLATTVDDGTAMNAPNDLVVTPDGTVWFTDPGHHPPPDPPIGRILKMARDGVVSVVDAPYHYCNGIGLDHTGALLVIEAAGLLRLHEDGSREWVIERLGTSVGDGFAVDVEGHAYVCCPTDNCVRVIDPKGTEVERLDLSPLASPGMVTNCCFGGPEGRTLFATHSIPGTVVMWDDLPHPGRPVHPWPGLLTT